MTVRFDDSLATVLASDAASGFGAQATWRQLVDLIGRGRVAPAEPTIARLRSLRAGVAPPVRAASARALAFAHPPAPLVALFAEDDLAIAAPVLRTARLAAADWLALLPKLTPQGRSVLRHRRDLPDSVQRGLASFGNVDFVLADARPPERADATASPRQNDRRDTAEAAAATADGGGFAIADLVARIDAFQRQHDAPAAEPAARDHRFQPAFRFETDTGGTIRRVADTAAAPLVGVSLVLGVPQGVVRADGVTAKVLRTRAPIEGALLVVGGTSAAAGAWRLAATAQFDAVTGRYVGYRGTARRSRRDDSVAAADARRIASESLRQLVHELRTPTNAIAGFAELIDTELLGPVAPPYRERATAIRRDTAALIAAIDDLDTLARIEGDSLELRPGEVAIEPLLTRICDDLAPLARRRGAAIAFAPAGEHRVSADDRAVARLIERLLAALVASAGEGETLAVKVKAKHDATIAIHVERPKALSAMSDGALLALDAGGEDGKDEDDGGAPLLGTGFALRLARDLALALGGSLAIGPARLTLRLPAALDREVGQAAQ